MLILQRRHSSKCPDQNKGPNYLKCRGQCVLRAVGTNDEGIRIRRTLRTRDLARAQRRLVQMEDGAFGRPKKPMEDAIAAFQAQHAGNSDETKRRYNRLLRYFTEFCSREQIHYVDQAGVDALDKYAVQRSQFKSWVKDVELLRQFFEFCRDRDWTTKNPARALKIPRMLEANDVRPYKHEEIIKIISACDKIGTSNYERRRARAMILLMRYAGLRISDVVTLERDHIKGNRLEKRAVKNRRIIRVELSNSVLEALEVLPHPREAARDNKRYFYSDATCQRTLVKAAWRTLHAVFKLSGVERAHPHRFRHTLASELLGKKDGSIEKVAGILGDSPAIVRRYYAKWTPEYQEQQDVLLREIHGTHLAQTEEQAPKC